MEWISEHVLQIIVALSVAIAGFLNNRKKEKNGEPADYDGDGVPDNQPRSGPLQGGQDPEEAERTRRIQEEIRRKIMERRAGGGQAVPPPLVAPRPVATPLPEVLTRRFETPKPLHPPLPVRTQMHAARDAEVLERQRALEEQMRELAAKKALVKRRAAEAETVSAAAVARMTTPGALSGPELLVELRDAEAMRRAFVLREVLSPPPGLR